MWYFAHESVVVFKSQESPFLCSETSSFSFFYLCFLVIFCFFVFVLKGRLPVKWTAYEALLFGVYTTQSDV